MTDTSEWTGRVGTAWADEWRRTDRSFGALTDQLLNPAAIGGFDAALDIGCGAGELVQRLAVAHPAARVIGIDISAELVAVARGRCAGLANAEVEEGDAAAWRAPQGRSPNLLISRHGVMFFPDPVAAFAHLRAEAAAGAHLRFSCFRARADNGWAVALGAALPQTDDASDSSVPGPFAFADRDRVIAILADAGWGEIAFEAFDYAMIAGEGEGAREEAVAYFQRIGPAARALRELTEDQRLAALDRLRAVIDAHHVAGRIVMPSAAWLVTARAR